MSAADERRAQLFLKNKERVANHNKKVMELKGTRASSQGNQKLVRLEQKVTAAEERRMEFMRKNLDKVTAHNKRVMERKVFDSPEQKLSKHAAKVSAAEERRSIII